MYELWLILASLRLHNTRCYPTNKNKININFSPPKRRKNLIVLCVVHLKAWDTHRYTSVMRDLKINVHGKQLTADTFFAIKIAYNILPIRKTKNTETFCLTTQTWWLVFRDLSAPRTWRLTSNEVCDINLTVINCKFQTSTWTSHDWDTGQLPIADKLSECGFGRTKNVRHFRSFKGKWQ